MSSNFNLQRKLEEYNKKIDAFIEDTKKRIEDLEINKILEKT